MQQAMLITDRDTNINYKNRTAQDIIIRYFSYKKSNTEFSNHLQKLSNENCETVVNNLKLRRCLLPSLKTSNLLCLLTKNHFKI